MQWEPGQTLRDVEDRAILQALRHFAGDKLATAAALDISVKKIRYRCRDSKVLAEFYRPPRGTRRRPPRKPEPKLPE